MSEEDDGLFSRWSRRKRLVAEENRSAGSTEPTETTLDEPEPESEEDEAVLLERFGLPVPESLKTGDDFTVFMQAGVPGFLRKRALRVLWRSNPVLANLDGLNDYDADFRSPELTGKVLATGYKIGRGFLKDEVTQEILHNNDVEKQAGEPFEEEAAAQTTIADETQISIDTTNPDRSSPADDEEDFSFHPKRMRFDT